MSPQQRAAEIAFNKRYSRFKLQVFFKHRNPITHYGNERKNCSVSQIIYGHIKKFYVYRDAGLQDCVDRISLVTKLYGDYTTAIIYDNKLKTTLPDGTTQKGREIIKYVAGKRVEYVEDEKIFSISPKQIEVKSVKNAEGKIDIVPVIPINIDFGKLVSQRLKQ